MKLLILISTLLMLQACGTNPENIKQKELTNLERDFQYLDEINFHISDDIKQKIRHLGLKLKDKHQITDEIRRAKTGKYPYPSRIKPVLFTKGKNFVKFNLDKSIYSFRGFLKPDDLYNNIPKECKKYAEDGIYTGYSHFKRYRGMESYAYEIDYDEYKEYKEDVKSCKYTRKVAYLDNNFNVLKTKIKFIHKTTPFPPTEKRREQKYECPYCDIPTMKQRMKYYSEGNYL